MNIALIYPSINRLSNEVMSKKLINFYFNEGLVTPPLGICYLGAVLKQNGHKILLLDLNKEQRPYSDIIAQLTKFEPQIIGISILTHAFQDAIRLINILKSHFQYSKIIVGGYHLSLYPKETLEYKEIDYGVIGDGEQTIVELVSAIEKNDDVSKIRGICYKEKDVYIQTPSRPLIHDLDSIPFPAYADLDFSKYTTFFSDHNVKIASMITSRGCPFSCRFCSEKYDAYRHRSLENVIEEVSRLYHEFGVREICFEDSTFTVNKSFVTQFCNELITRNINIRYNIRTRIDCIDEELLKILKKSGCTRIHFGIESGTNELLQKLGKKETIEQQQQIIKLTKKVGIEVWAFFMIGVPGETYSSISKTFQHALKLDPDFVQFNRFNPFPGTPIYQEYLEKGGKDIWREYVLGKRKDYNVQLLEESIPNAELDNICRKLYLRFYYRPSVIIKKLKKIRSIKMLINYIKAAWALI